MTDLRDDFIDLVSGQLSAFSGFGSLRDFDLQFLRVRQIFRSHAETAAGHLLDGAAAADFAGTLHIARGILSAFPGIAFPADLVHG